jgi:hypothetical protein
VADRVHPREGEPQILRPPSRVGRTPPSTPPAPTPASDRARLATRAPPVTPPASVSLIVPRLLCPRARPWLPLCLAYATAADLFVRAELFFSIEIETFGYGIAKGRRNKVKGTLVFSLDHKNLFYFLKTAKTRSKQQIRFEIVRIQLQN